MPEPSGPPQPPAHGAEIAPWGLTASASGEEQLQSIFTVPPLDEHVQRAIADAALQATGEAPAGEPWEINEHDPAHAAMHQAVRDKAAELDVAPTDYYRTNPEAVQGFCVADCLQDWPEIGSVAYQAHPDDEHLSLRDASVVPIPLVEEDDVTQRDVLFSSTAGMPAPPEQTLDEPKNEIASHHNREDVEMTSTQDDVRAIIASISAPDVLYGSDGLWQSVAAEAWINKAEAAGHNIEATDWHPSDQRAVAHVRANGGWLTLTYNIDGQGALVYAEDRLDSVDEDYLAERDRIEERALVIQVVEDTGVFDHLGEPPEFEELPPDLQHELHMRTPVEPLGADDPAVAQIKAAAISADDAVRAPDAVRAFEARRAEELGPDARMWNRLDTTPERAHEAWHQAIRSTCADLGVDPGAYFATEPDEVARCDVDCAETWPEITTVAVVEYPWDIDLTMRCDLETDTLAEAQTTAAEAEVQGRDDQADWLRLNEHTLDEDPPATDLDSGLGCGY